MNKKRKFISIALASALFLGIASPTFVACKDYDDDINNLQRQIDEINVTIKELQELIDAGYFIKSITNTDNGISILMSNGKTYTLTNGQDGKSVVWTIGQDGYWYQDGVKTQYKAVGVDGKQGAKGDKGDKGDKGAKGDKGDDGKDGKYYVPNQETGCFDIYQDGKFVSSTDIKWRGTEEEGKAGISAVLSGNTLTLSGVKGETDTVVIYIGKQLGSVAFVPEVMSSVVSYPTTTDEFYHLATYLNESKYNASTKVFVPQTNWKKSNIVNMLYRLNPEDAYVDDLTIVSFLNRSVSTRAAANDKFDLLSVEDNKFENGIASINATVDPSALSTDSKNDIVALQVWVGQNAVTSDYVHIASSAIDVILADTVKTVVGTGAVEFYARTKSIKGAAENDAFIKQYVALDAPANFAFKYDESIDLKEKVGLYSNDKLEYLAKLGFVGMSYEFSLPTEYNATDQQKTNQQWFVEMTDGVVKANAKNLVNGLTPAIGRTPVVRVDAYLTANGSDNKYLVASSYIKLSIERTTPQPGVDKPDYVVNMGKVKEYEYHTLAGAQTTVVNMPYTDINNYLYGLTGLNAQNFWNYYGGNDDTYSVKISTIGKTGQPVVVSGFAKANALYRFPDDASIPGVFFSIMLNNEAQTSSNVEFLINNLIKTENTFKDIDGKGAKYTFEIVIPSDNKKVYGDFKLVQEFYVREDCKNFTYNPLYYYDNFAGTSNCIVVKGQLNRSWEMSSVVSEHFEMINGKNIFGYFNTINNVKSLEFQWKSGVTGVTPGANEVKTNDFTVALSHAMTQGTEVKNMTYKTVLVNGEQCDFNYNIVFVNPFKAGSAKGISVYGNGIGENIGQTMPQVLVMDNDNDVIYSYDATAGSLVLSDKATDDYKVAVPTVTYTFDKTGADYKELINNMSQGSILNVDAATGEFTWKNEGAQLKRDYNLTVIAKVTFANLSEVQCRIPVVLTATK